MFSNFFFTTQRVKAVWFLFFIYLSFASSVFAQKTILIAPFEIKGFGEEKETLRTFIAHLNRRGFSTLASTEVAPIDVVRTHLSSIGFSAGVGYESEKSDVLQISSESEKNHLRALKKNKKNVLLISGEIVKKEGKIYLEWVFSDVATQGVLSRSNFVFSLPNENEITYHFNQVGITTPEVNNEILSGYVLFSATFYQEALRSLLSTVSATTDKSKGIFAAPYEVPYYFLSPFYPRNYLSVVNSATLKEIAEVIDLLEVDRKETTLSNAIVRLGKGVVNPYLLSSTQNSVNYQKMLPIASAILCEVVAEMAVIKSIDFDLSAQNFLDTLQILQGGVNLLPLNREVATANFVLSLFGNYPTSFINYHNKLVQYKMPNETIERYLFLSYKMPQFFEMKVDEKKGGAVYAQFESALFKRDYDSFERDFILANARLSEAHELKKGKKFKEADQRYHKTRVMIDNIVKKYPQQPLAFLVAGEFYIRIENSFYYKPEIAFDLATEALRLSQNKNPLIIAFYARALSHRGERQKALVVIDELIKVHPITLFINIREEILNIKAKNEFRD